MGHITCCEFTPYNVLNLFLELQSYPKVTVCECKQKHHGLDILSVLESRSSVETSVNQKHEAPSTYGISQTCESGSLPGDWASPGSVPEEFMLVNTPH